MEQRTDSNRLHLAGRIVGPVLFSHTVGETAFCSFLLAAERRSGVADVLPVHAAERRLPQALQEGDFVAVDGQLRSYRRASPDGAAHVRLIAFAKDVRLEREYSCGNGPYENEVLLTGRLVYWPVYRQTPARREIADLLIAVARPTGPHDFLPVIAWGALARLAASLDAGTRLSVCGRLQSRAYQKRLPDGSVSDRIAYEVSASELSAAP